MRVGGNTVLITGGATGIGLALASEFMAAGSEVIVCGRRQWKLEEAKLRLPGLHTRSCDLSVEKERWSLFDWVTSSFEKANILVNNAGVQRMIDLRNGETELHAGDDEVEINLRAYIHLASLFTPVFMERDEAAIVNVSSALGFVPIAVMPVYCATKAAVHIYTVSLRHQLRDTQVRVFELIPPTVDTELDRGARVRRGQAERGIPPEVVARAAIEGIARGDPEIVVGEASRLRNASPDAFTKIFDGMNRW